MAANVSGSMSGRPIRRGASTSRRRHSRCTIKIHNTNPEWGDGFEGFTKRLGSRQAQFIIQNSVTSFGDGVLGLGAALRPLPLRRILAAHAACDCQEFRNLRADREIVTTPSHAVPR